MRYYSRSSQETVNFYVPNSIKCKYVKQNPRITEKNGQLSKWMIIISWQNIGGDIKNLEYLYLLPMKNIKQYFQVKTDF